MASTTLEMSLLEIIPKEALVRHLVEKLDFVAVSRERERETVNEEFQFLLMQDISQKHLKKRLI